MIMSKYMWNFILLGVSFYKYYLFQISLSAVYVQTMLGYSIEPG